MALSVPVQMAASLALKRYLESVMPDVVVEPKWPDPDKSLPVKAITIIPAGPRKLMFLESPQLIGSEDLSPSSPLKIYKWRIAECEQSFQMDVWSQFSADRDDICARLDNFLNAGFSQLSNATVSTESVDQNLVLELSDGWEDSNAYYVFDSFDYDDTPDQVTRQEYRATYSGIGYFNLSNKAIKPSIAAINIKLKLENETDYTTFTP